MDLVQRETQEEIKARLKDALPSLNKTTGEVFYEKGTLKVPKSWDELQNWYSVGETKDIAMPFLKAAQDQFDGWYKQSNAKKIKLKDLTPKQLKEAITARWVFVAKAKFDENKQRELEIAKGRVVTHGFKEIMGIHCWEVYAPTMKRDSTARFFASFITASEHGRQTGRPVYYLLADEINAFMSVENLVGEAQIILLPQNLCLPGCNFDRDEDGDRCAFIMPHAAYGGRGSPRACHVKNEYTLLSKQQLRIVRHPIDDVIYIRQPEFEGECGMIVKQVDDFIMFSNVPEWLVDVVEALRDGGFGIRIVDPGRIFG